MDTEQKYQAAIRYIRAKVDELLGLMGTLPLRPEELDDETLIDLDPIGIIAGSFRRILDHLGATNRRLDLATREIRTILDNLHAAVLVVDSEERVAECNRRALDWLFAGAAPENVIGRRLGLLCPCGPEVLAGCRSGGHWERELALDGRRFHVVATDLGGTGGSPRSVVLISDLTRQKEAEDELRLFAKVFGNVAEGIVITDPARRILTANDAYQRITGFPLAELVGHTPAVLQSGHQDHDFYRGLWQAIETQGWWQGEILDRTRSGAVVPLLETISAVRDGDGVLTHYIGVIADITPLKETQSRLKFLAHHDALTGLPNRLLFNDRLGHAIDLARREGTELAVLFIDLDRFKTVNDSLGHHVGDEILIEAARRLKALVRQSDSVARLGGDEFVILLERIGARDALVQCERLLDALRLPFLHRELELHVGCSVGITLYPEDGADAATLLRNADAAMYRAKESGRDTHFRYTKEVSEATRERLTIESALQVAVRRCAFEVHYQPIVELATGRMVAAEALVRWPGAPHPYDSPSRFIPVAEDLRLIVPLGRWVLREALAELGRWREQGLGLDYVSVNISAVQLAEPDFARDLSLLLDEAGVQGPGLQIEVTENHLMKNMDHAADFLGQLRGRGVRVAIDDFGTGYSSLAYLRQLPIDVLKIDRSFVRDLPGDANGQAIASAILALAKTLGFTAVAEGVETVAQESFLAEAGCHLGQGYLYAPPLPTRDLAGLTPWPQGRARGLTPSE